MFRLTEVEAHLAKNLNPSWISAYVEMNMARKVKQSESFYTHKSQCISVQYKLEDKCQAYHLIQCNGFECMAYHFY